MARSQTARFGLWRWSDPGDTQGQTDFDSDNAALEALAAIALSGDFADRPAAHVRDQLYLARDVGRVYWDDGAAWHLIHVVDPLLAQSVPGGGSSTGTINTLVAQDIATISPVLPAGVTRVKISGTVWISTGAGVGAVVQLTGMSDAKTRTINQSGNGDVGIPFAYDVTPVAGAKTYRLKVASTVSGQDVTWRAPMLTAEILG